jgi:BirA family biotin operon repressor/biotin-[acetyl-CoA-carboxylase] ligase
LAPDQVWRLAATVSLAMADAGEAIAGLPDGAIRLKWPNDLVIATDADGRALDGASLGVEEARTGGTVRKLGGVLGETDGLGTDDPRVVIGIGLNADWPAATFPADLASTMASLRSVAADRPVKMGLLLDAFITRVETRIAALFAGRFDASGWVDRQVTTGRQVDLVRPDGSVETVTASGVDPVSGALRVADPSTRAPGGERTIVVGEILRVRLAGV